MVVELNAVRRRKLVGAFATLFGAFGAVCPLILFLLVSAGREDVGTPQVDSAPFIIAFLAHTYLVVAGVLMLRGRKVRFLGSFLALESAYAIFHLVLGPALVLARLSDSSSAIWLTSANLGFFAQIAAGFPLWAWFLVRERSNDAGE
jgi:hypothetical protein